MDKKDIVQLGSYLTDSILSEKISAEQLFKKIATILPGDSKSSYKLFQDIWNNKCRESGNNNADISQPMLLSRGFSRDITTEEQLSSFLPEEKILINKDIFRSHLEGLDLVKLDSIKQKHIMDTLIKESIGLSSNDVLLYYNLIKINQLSNSSTNNTSNSIVNEDIDYPTELYQLAVKAFNLNAHNIKKINGKSINEDAVSSIITDAIKKRRINPQVLALCLGRNNKKFIDFLTDFMTFFISQRGDDAQEIFTYMGFYILFHGSTTAQTSNLNLSSNLEAFITDRIGRVRSVYYVAMLFAHTFSVILAAQIFEISAKYHNSPLEQRLKLEKLYSADNRRQLLVQNAISIASRKISSYKSESLEVQNAIKRFMSNKKDLISVKDIFQNDYRS
ncbi:MAG: hypothetical protein OCD02_10665 [Spirochaetaceae bacterium]